MIRSWELAKLRQKGMKYESIAAGEEKISGCEVNKVGAYSYQRKYYSYLTLKAYSSQNI